MLKFLLAVVLQTEGIEEGCSNGEFRQLTNLQVLGDAVFHVVSCNLTKERRLRLVIPKAHN